MQPFNLTLANGATLTGVHNLPNASVRLLTHRPLLVGLHGGGYTSQYFDVDPKHTAALQSNALGVPWVAINRPCYEGSTSLYPIPEGSSFHEEFGSWLHRYILPALWEEFGRPHECNSIVLHCHSLGTAGAVIAAAAHSKEGADAGYPLAGITISGFGTMLIKKEFDLADVNNPPESISLPQEVRTALMLPVGTADQGVYNHAERLNRPCPFDELHTVWSVWLPRLKAEWGPQVKVPILIGMAERDCFWVGTEEHVRDFVGAFSGSERVDGSLIRRAPHNLEMSYWAQGWYARCFGFAIECAASYSART